MWQKTIKKLLAKIRRLRKTLEKKSDKKKIVLGIAIITAFGVLYYFKGFFVAALVNGQPISRFSLIKELEKQQGSEVLESLITETLIFQEAKRQGIRTTPEEINAKIEELEKDLEEQGQNLDQLLSFQKMTKAHLQKQIKIQKLIEKMLGEKAVVTEEEIDRYLEANQDLLPQDMKPEELRENIKQQLKQQKLGENFDSWLMNLKEQAKIHYFVNYW